MTPCSYIHQYVQDNGDTVKKECNVDKDEQFKYLTQSLNMLILHNSERLDNQKYGDEKIVKESKIDSMQFDPRDPSYIAFNIKLNEIHDNTQLVSFGDSEDTEFITFEKQGQLSSSWRDDLSKDP